MLSILFDRNDRHQYVCPMVSPADPDRAGHERREHRSVTVLPAIYRSGPRAQSCELRRGTAPM